MKLIVAMIALLATGGMAIAETSELVTSRVIAYKDISPNETLVLKRYGPSGQEAGVALPCAVFFFGGGWNGGNIGHFAPQATHLAQRGMVAICVQYRTRTSHEVPPNVCLMDAKSAIRFIRRNAESLGIDPQRLAVGGGSAGGHLAAASTFCSGFNTVGEDRSISTRADALLLFNPVIDNGPDGYGHERVSEFWRAFSPLHNVSSPPPTLFLLGDKDDLVPVETGKAFQSAIQSAGGRCDLKIYPGGTHGFFNQGRPTESGIEYFDDCVSEMDRFLVSLGFLQP